MLQKTNVFNVREIFLLKTGKHGIPNGIIGFHVNVNDGNTLTANFRELTNLIENEKY